MVNILTAIVCCLLIQIVAALVDAGTTWAVMAGWVGGVIWVEYIFTVK